jgi:paraquat-inducible protein A
MPFDFDIEARAELSRALSATALIVSVPANFFPFMKLQMFGQVQNSTIWGGIETLFRSGEWFVATVIFLASLVIPLLKIVCLLYLSTHIAQSRKVCPSRADGYLRQMIEVLGRWSMLDIFLVAILIAMLKFGKIAHAEIRSGAVYFLLVVLLTMAASELISEKSLQKRVHA